ncbi:MAG: ribonuclease PH, partial [Armatimonadota bacterium]
PTQMRPVKLQRGFSPFAEGSCLITIGKTIVHVTATVEGRVPPWMKGQGTGWVTAEYGMLPRSGRERNQRDLMRPNGRTMEIQRLIGRALRSVVDLSRIGEWTITVDCDAIQADGGTRTAAITAAYVALHDALEWMISQRIIEEMPLREVLAAVSVGTVNDTEMLDLCYEEDSKAEVDMNLVMTDTGRYVEIQGTAESAPFNEERLARMLALGKKGIEELVALQKQALGLA